MRTANALFPATGDEPFRNGTMAGICPSTAHGTDSLGAAMSSNGTGEDRGPVGFHPPPAVGQAAERENARTQELSGRRLQARR